MLEAILTRLLGALPSASPPADAEGGIPPFDLDDLSSIDTPATNATTPSEQVRGGANQAAPAAIALQPIMVFGGASTEELPGSDTLSTDTELPPRPVLTALPPAPADTEHQPEVRPPILTIAEPAAIFGPLSPGRITANPADGAEVDGPEGEGVADFGSDLPPVHRTMGSEQADEAILTSVAAPTQGLASAPENLPLQPPETASQVRAQAGRPLQDRAATAQTALDMLPAETAVIQQGEPLVAPPASSSDQTPARRPSSEQDVPAAPETAEQSVDGNGTAYTDRIAPALGESGGLNDRVGRLARSAAPEQLSRSTQHGLPSTPAIEREPTQSVAGKVTASEPREAIPPTAPLNASPVPRRNTMPSAETLATRIADPAPTTTTTTTPAAAAPSEMPVGTPVAIAPTIVQATPQPLAIDLGAPQPARRLTDNAQTADFPNRGQLPVASAGPAPAAPLSTSTCAAASAAPAAATAERPSPPARTPIARRSDAASPPPTLSSLDQGLPATAPDQTAAQTSALPTAGGPTVGPLAVETTRPVLPARHDAPPAPAQAALPAATAEPVWPGPQISAKVRHMQGHTVEIELSPRELGHLKMSMLSGQDGMTVAIHVERAETLDLLRRHVDQLAKDFRDAGMSDVNFFFSQNRSSHSDGRQPPLQPLPEEPALTPARQPISPNSLPHSAQPSATGALDLRL
ncbi:flagellar hook-length control protein FliK [Frigidibacter sp. MR17.14]|uniref:flagellar hook-length control protein FliK n=1 Tax=Frigidibacter sp. MR17.14 TaxID=3126509 RepID=UPI003012F488